jgi:hypothetical protein
MSASDPFTVIEHRLATLQDALLNSANAGNMDKPLLHWGQFVSPQHGNVQAGVYGSAASSAVAFLRERDDTQGRDARDRLRTYVESDADAQNQLSHNIKLAMVVLALCPSGGQAAHATMLGCLNTLLDRFSSAAGLWPAFSRALVPGAPYAFLDSGSEVATAVIVLLLWPVGERLTNSLHVGERARVRTALDDAAKRLESACVANAHPITRFESTIACAVLLVKGAGANPTVRRAFKRAASDIDFVERRVFFYECIDGHGRFTRDYFIVPPDALLPLVCANKAARGADRVVARYVAERLCGSLDHDGLFRAGQQTASTVEQLLVGLSLDTVLSTRTIHRGPSYQLANFWHYSSRPTTSGRPAPLAIFVVGVLWLLTGLAVVLPQLPSAWMQWADAAVSAQVIAGFVPEWGRALLVFLVGALPTSKELFLRLIGRGAQ